MIYQNKESFLVEKTASTSILANHGQPTTMRWHTARTPIFLAVRRASFPKVGSTLRYRQTPQSPDLRLTHAQLFRSTVEVFVP